MIIIIAVAHAVVDMVSICCLLNLTYSAATESSALILWGLYVLFAFVMQSPLGLLADYLNRPATTVISGCLFVAAAPFFLLFFPAWLPLLLVSLGNALFHVGGGMLALSLAKGKAAFSGIYVAPGALGVAAGVFLASLILDNVLLAVLIAAPLIAAAFIFVAVIFAKKSDLCLNTVHHFTAEKFIGSRDDIYLYAAVFFLGLTVAARAYTGEVLSSLKPEKLAFALTFAVFTGKILGGYFADKFGWKKFILAAQFVSLPMFYFGESVPLLFFIGVCLFNTTTAVTLTAISNLLPGFAGFSFGLTALAVAVGTLLKLYFPYGHFLLPVLWAILLFFIGIYLYYNIVFRLSEKDKCIQHL